MILRIVVIFEMKGRDVQCEDKVDIGFTFICC